MHKVLAFALLLLAIACAAPKARQFDRSSCEQTEQEEYHRCVQPTYFQEGQRLDVPRSDEIQACERAYHQALRRCASYDRPVPPAIDLSRTSSSGAARD